MKETHITNMERPFREYLRANKERTHKIRVEFRNVARYLQKVNEIVQPDEREKFIQQTLDNITEIFGEKGEHGPDIACVDTGFFRHPYIFRDTVIEVSRTAPHTPTHQGLLITSPDYVQWEKSNYNNIFDMVYSGQESEVQTLKDYISNLWA